MPKPVREHGRSGPLNDMQVDARKAIESTEFRLKWLEQEVAILEEKIQFFDDLSFKIKGWAIATWSALVTYALSKHEWRVSAVACLVPILFLLVDASYKRYQVCFIERTRDIMRLLNNPDSLTAPPKEGGYSFVVYDLLGIHGRGKQETSFNRQWGPIARLAAKGSVGLVYWVLVLIGAVISLHLLTSVPKNLGG
jgi:hypothetical protein